MLQHQKVVSFTVTLNKEAYKETIGPVPIRLHQPRTILYATSLNWNGEITSAIKESLIMSYWNKVGGTGSQNIPEKMSQDLFTIEIKI
jgi:hypothetical protein